MRHKEYRGKTALVYYRGGAAGEEIVEDHSPAVQSEPERILLGSGEVPLGVSDVLYDMEVGEERRAVIPCDRAFGRHDPEGVQRYARMLVPGGDRLEAGVVFAWAPSGDGRKRAGQVRGSDQRRRGRGLQPPAGGQRPGILVQAGRRRGRRRAFP